jgi:signal recognition particle subunit SRP72
MDTSTDEAVEQLFARLESHIRNGQTKKAFKTIDEILKVIPNDPEALRCKVVLLIDQGNTEAALRLIDSSNDLLSSEALSLERAYCLYRQGKLDEAFQALGSIDPARDVARLLLEGQLHYRMGNYGAAIQAYDVLYSMAEGGDAKAKALGGSAEVQANVVAAYVSEGRVGGDEINNLLSHKLHTTPRAGFELAFNVACGLLRVDKMDEAREALTLARRVGEEALYEEDFGDEDDISAELLPVDAQLAYLTALEHVAKPSSWDDALAQLISLSGTHGDKHFKGGDKLSRAVVAINLVGLLLRTRPGDRRAASEGLKALEPFIERRGGYLGAASSINLRLGVQHVEQLLVAYCAAAITAGKMETAREALRSLQKLQSPKTALLMHAALLTKENKSKEAIALLEKSEPDAQPPALFMRAQVEATRSAVGGEGLSATLSALQTLPLSIRNRAGVLATQIALLSLQGNVDGALQLIRQSIQSSEESERDGDMKGLGMHGQVWLRKKAADLEVGRGNLEAAMEYLTPLLLMSTSSSSSTSTMAIRTAGIEGIKDAIAQDEKLLMLVPWIVAAADESDEDSPHAGELEKEKLLSLLSERFALSELDSEVSNPVIPSREELDMLETSLPAATLSHNKPSQAHAVTGQDGAVGVSKENRERKKKNRKRKKRYPQGYDPANPPPPPDPERWLPKWQRSDAKKSKKKRKDKEKDMLKGSQGAGKVDASLDRTGPSAGSSIGPSSGTSSSSATAKIKSSKKKGKSRR